MLRLAFHGNAGRPPDDYRSVMGQSDQPFAVAVGVRPAPAFPAAVSTSAVWSAEMLASAGYHTPSEPWIENPEQRLASTPAGHTELFARGPTGLGVTRVRGPEFPGPLALKKMVAESEPAGPPPAEEDA